MPPREVVDLQLRTSEVFRRAQRANVTIYPVDPTGLGGLKAYLTQRLGPNNEFVAAHKATTQQDYSQAAAANTGGRAIMHTNEFEPGIRDIFAENSSYYLLGFEAASSAADGKLHRVEVKVNRPAWRSVNA
jgi:VWFA-related protein